MSLSHLNRARKRFLYAAWVSLWALAQSGCAPEATPTAPPAAPTVTATVRPTGTATPAATATVDCRAGPGRVDSITYPSLLLDEPIPVRVYVPPCHDQTTQAFPTLYLLHGYPYDETEWELLGLETLVDEAVRSGDWPPLLVVMPRVPDPLFRSTDGGPYSYEAELTEGLVSFIDLTYHSDPRPDRRAIAGISRGGVWSLEIALNNPDVFDGVAAISPALALNSARKEYDPVFIVRRGEALPSKIYLLAGDEDWARQATEDFALLLDGLGVAHQLVVYRGGHEDASWAPELGPLITYLTADWPRP
jgi:enterochelin esterase-like enzyme